MSVAKILRCIVLFLSSSTRCSATSVYPFDASLERSNEGVSSSSRTTGSRWNRIGHSHKRHSARKPSHFQAYASSSEFHDAQVHLLRLSHRLSLNGNCSRPGRLAIHPLETFRMLLLRDIARHGLGRDSEDHDTERSRVGDDAGDKTGEEAGLRALWRGRSTRALNGVGTLKSEQSLMGAVYPNGIYYTSMRLGTPAQTFNLDIDTGSSLLWVNCLPCNPCTTSQTLTLSPPFDASKSYTAKTLPCNDPVCVNPDKTVPTAKCKTRDPAKEACVYSVGYADGSSTTGTLLTDYAHLPLPASSSQSIHVPVVIGCGNTQTGNFYDSPGWTYYQPLDGLMGLGRGPMSIMTSIGAHEKGLKLSPTLAHCLGGPRGGGWMMFGAVPIPDQMAFTTLFPGTWYKVHVMRVTVGGRLLSVNPHIYGNTTAANAILDSGTTFTILPDPFVSSILNLIQKKVGLPRYTYAQTDAGSLCFAANSSVSLAQIRGRFPAINVQFTGQNVFMNLPPSTYTFYATDGTKQLVCTQLQRQGTDIKTTDGVLFVIGELWMRDQLVVYQQDQNRVGWASMQC